MQHGEYQEYDTEPGSTDLLGLASTPIEPSHARDNVAAFDGQSVYEEMSAVLMHREKEFLGFLCQPLEDLEENLAESCIEALADELRAKVNCDGFHVVVDCVLMLFFQLTDILENSAATSAAQFDQELLAVLASNSFLSDMEMSRNDIVQYLHQNSPK